MSINTAYISQFNSNLYHLLSSSGSRLKGLFMEKNEKGEKVFFDRIDKLSVYTQTSAGQETARQLASFSRRMVTTEIKRAAIDIDELYDLTNMLIDPTSAYAEEMAKAHGRAFDIALFNALLGDASTGKIGDGTQAFDSNNVIAHGSAGLTPAKVDQAIRMLKEKHVDFQRENVYLFLNARAEEDLIADNRVVSGDYQNRKVLAEKSFPTYRGLILVHSEDIPAIDASNFRAILCTGKALGVNIQKDMETTIDRIPDRSNVNLLQTVMKYGAVRMDEDLVIDIRFQ